MTHTILTPQTALLRMPGATLVTRLRVYDTPTPDGQRGGTPHFHFMCTEMYFVLSGHGAVEMIDQHGFSTVELAPHSALIFSPGTIHRLINPAGDLEILVVMQNSGLPERGDNVVVFTDAILGDDERYAGAMRVQSVDDAYRRRDRGVEGFIDLKRAFEQGTDSGQQALARVYQLATARTRSMVGEWRKIVDAGAKAELNRTYTQFEALERGDFSYLNTAQHHLIPAGEYKTPGFCGHLNRYFDPATLMPEGVAKQ